MIAGSVQRLGDFFPHTATTGFAVGESQIDTIAALRFLIPGVGGAFHGHSLFAGIAGAKVNAVFILRVQAKGGFSALLETAAVLSFIFTVGSEDGTAAIKNAGALAPAAYPDFVISCNQTFGVILLSDFRVAPFQLNQRRFIGSVGAVLTHTEHPGIIPASVGNAAVVSCLYTAGVLGNSWIAFAKVDKIHSRSSGKSAAVACGDRKYFSSTSGSKMSISDKVYPLSVLRYAVES